MSISTSVKTPHDHILDPGIECAVEVLRVNGVETVQSCEGGEGHAFPVPTVQFTGHYSEGLRALSVALENGLPVASLRRTWNMSENSLEGPLWEITFYKKIPFQGDSERKEVLSGHRWKIVASNYP